ncbi:asparagine synthase (glutamine-hydrolyzing) [Flavobacterium sp. 245]|uniref:asparagine synthase (glutamine-hydrolyzing) n=1 Tax=Flavobacterium sp. 245 TaxID=2512115 RepID=UPI00105C39E0|nr:asparagine synthase (glutamine-hydrolyzing) [Flavobacterium sp. 245]TDP02434.1 asparagine synthase (glutamine-hydrolysing) [Flavobacterium sp. 245]
MCGILVNVGSVGKDKFIQALNLQTHRGPDSFGYDKIDNVSFGHRRLSIIDLNECSNQPMRNRNERYTIVFNGEIYNYKEIREELIELGYLFETDGDTEVLLNAYEAFGVKVLDRLIGMFAFVIYDNLTKEIFVARDRLGVKPLFYTINNDGMIFSSEVKSILSLDGFKRKLNLHAVSSYLSYRYPIMNDTFFEGINVFPSAHWMKIDSDGQKTIEKYWDFDDKISLQKEDKGEKYYIDKLKELITSAVKYRMVSDVPVGAYLSGGVDSSIVTYELAKLKEGVVNTFTIGFAEEGYNEFSYSKIVSDLCNTNHKEILLDEKNYFEAMTDLIKVKDAPLGVPNEVPLFLMSKILKKDITVVLSGEGADEILAGYSRIFSSSEDFKKMSDPELEKDSLLSQKLSSKYGEDFPKSEIEHFLSLYQYCSSSFKSKLFHSNIDSTNIEKDLNEVFSFNFEKLDGESYLNKMLYCFEKIHLPGLLNRLDTTTMAASVEGRVPFVDHRLIEFAFSIPNHYKLKWTGDKTSLDTQLGSEMAENSNVPKYILKKSYEDIIPNEILYRKKMGFPVPLNNWFGNDFKDLAYSKIINGYLIGNKIINKDFFLELINNYEVIGNKEDIGMKIWMILNLELFLSDYFKKID